MPQHRANNQVETPWPAESARSLGLQLSFLDVTAMTTVERYVTNTGRGLCSVTMSSAASVNFNGICIQVGRVNVEGRHT